MDQLQLFEYDQLEQIDRDFIQDRTLEIKSLVKRSAQDIIEIGLKLIEVKERLPHGMWGQWLDREFGWGQDTAHNFMRVSIKFGNFPNLENFGQSALYLLASPSTPDEAINEAIDRASRGETISHKMAKKIVMDHKGTEEPPTEQPPIVSPVVPCPICRNLYDIGVFTNGCPYCYKEKNDLSGWVEGLPDKMKGDGGEIEPNATRPMKPKLNQAGSIYEPKGYDACQTPAYAIDPLLPYLDADWVIWEPAAGENNLVEAFYDSSYSTDQVVISDILTGQNFFEFKPEYWDCLITNPPYSIKYQWLERCYQLGKPFALLVPVEILGAKTAQILLKKYGFEMMLLNKRVDFKMPNKGWDSSAQFPVLWLCWQILPDKVMFGEINKNG
jgi:hypothetical protein